MDVQMSIAASPVASTTPAAGNNAPSGSAGAFGALVGGEGSFTQVLEGQLTDNSPSDPTDPSLTLAGLLQMLQALTAPMQNLVQDTGKESAESSLPEQLLQAMNSNSELADRLLQDPGMKQWFEQAQELLSAISGSMNLTMNTSFSNLLDSGNQTNGLSSLQAQNTLLTLASLSKQQPDNPVLNYLNEGLQKAMEPVLPQLVEAAQPKTEASSDSEFPLFETAEPSGTDLLAAKALHKQDSNRQDSERNPDLIPMQMNESAKSKLEALAARTVFSIPAADTKSEAAVVEQPAADLPSEATTTTDTMVHANELIKAPQFVAGTEKAVPQTIHASNFATEMTEHMLKNMKVTLADGISEAKLSLFPKNLGHVDVKITMHEGQLVAQFSAETLAGKQMLENQLPQLRQALQSQGLQVEKLEVTQNESMQSGMFQDHRQQQSSGQAFRQSKSRSGNYDQDAADFTQEMEQVSQSRKTVYGNSFDVTA